MKKHILLIAIISIIYPTINAQQPEPVIADTVNLDEIVVTGTTVKVNRNNIPMSVSVVGPKQISASDESALLPVLSGRVPGLFVTERGVTGFGVAGGAAGQITIRGIGGNPTTGVLMLIDGHPQYMGIFGHPLADSYVASDVEKVEVIRGPASILYGSNAMGGVINIITKKQHEDGIHANARIMYGSYNTQKYMANAGLKKNKFGAYMSVNHDQTDGHRDTSDFKLTNGYLKLNYEISNHVGAGADISLTKFKAADPGPDTLNAKAGQRIDITRGYWAVFIDNDFNKVSGTARFFYNFGEHNITDGFHSTDANYGINVFESLKLIKGNAITLGVDYMNYGGFAENVVFDSELIDTSVYETGIYGFIQQNFQNKLTVNAGLRLQHHKVYGNIWVPSGGIVYRPFAATSLKINYSKGFRSPAIRELFLWNHNEELAPEQVNSFEAGVSQTFLTGRLSLEVTGFKVKGDNMIVAGEMGKLYNTGKIDNTGIEALIKVNPVNNLNFSASYSYIHMDVPVYATPEHQLYISGDYQIGGFTLTGGVHCVSGLDTDASPAVTTDEKYTLVNAKISYGFKKYISLFISGENLLNQTYEANRYYPMPGTIFFAGLHFKI